MISNVLKSQFQYIKSQANMPDSLPSSSTHLTSTFISSLISPSSNWYQKVPQLNQRQWGKVESFLPTIQKIFKVIVGILIFPLGIYWLYEPWCLKAKEKSLPAFVEEIEDLPGFIYLHLSPEKLRQDDTMDSLVNHFSSPEVQEYRDNQFHFSVSELKQMQDSIQMSYNSNLLSLDDRERVLNKPHQETKPSDLYGRILSSLCVSLYDSKRTPRQKKNGELSFFRIYTCNLPKFERKHLSKINEYEKELTEVLLHFFHEAQLNKNEVVIFPPLDDFFHNFQLVSEESTKPQARQSFLNALEKVLIEKGQSFKKIIFADPGLIKGIEEMRKKDPFSNLIVNKKDFLEIAHLGAEKGLNVGLLNPTAVTFLPEKNPRSYLQKKVVHHTTALMAQEATCNGKKLLDSTRWRSYTPHE